METRAYLAHALSPLHVGTGQAADIIDLPIARQRATNIPYLPGSSIKGVLREAPRKGRSDEEWDAIFGPSRITTAEGGFAGALVAGDATVLALPVRSFKNTFAWVTSPLLLQLAHRDAPELIGGQAGSLTLPEVAHNSARVSDEGLIHRGKLYLEDLDLEAQADPAIAALAQRLAGKVWPQSPDVLTSRLALVDDNLMSFLLESATQLDARVRIDSETGTVAQGALWLEESLPPETLLLGLLSADRSRRKDTPLAAAEVLDAVLPADRPVAAQFGGKATVGRGRCELLAI